jgi:hypothetical protein
MKNYRVIDVLVKVPFTKGCWDAAVGSLQAKGYDMGRVYGSVFGDAEPTPAGWTGANYCVLPDGTGGCEVILNTDESYVKDGLRFNIIKRTRIVFC